MVGNISATLEMWDLLTPWAKNARIRARSCGGHRGGRIILRYRRAHCCNNVASIAHVRLMFKLKNQSEFTQMEDIGVEKGGG